MSHIVIPLIVAGILVHGLARRVDVYDAMIAGVKRGLSVCAGMFPAVLVMLTVIAMLRASGALELLGRLLAPALRVLGVPEDCLPLALMRPFTGSGALSLGREIMAANGPDSLSGRIAAVMLGAGETGFYTLGIYAGATGIRDIRKALIPMLLSAATVAVMAGVSVRWLM
jgi:spore maturation protein B